MPDKKPRKPPESPWQSVLARLDSFGERIERGSEGTHALVEDIRSDNRATLEGVETMREVFEGHFTAVAQRIDRLDQRIDRLEQRIDRLEQDTRARDLALEMAIRELRLDVRQVQGEVGGLTAKVE